MDLPGKSDSKEKLQHNLSNQHEKELKDDKPDAEDELSDESIDSQIVSKNMENLHVISVANYAKGSGKTLFKIIIKASTILSFSRRKSFARSTEYFRTQWSGTGFAQCCS